MTVVGTAEVVRNPVVVVDMADSAPAVGTENATALYTGIGAAPAAVEAGVCCTPAATEDMESARIAGIVENWKMDREQEWGVLAGRDSDRG